MRIFIRSLAVATALCLAPQAFASDCPALPGTSLQCVATEHGWFYAQDVAAANKFAAAAADDAAKFPRYFGRPAPRGAVVSMAVSEEARAVLKAAGARWIMPFPPPQKPYRDEAEAGNILRHEIGHKLYGAVFESEAVANRAGAAGSSRTLSDWTNEAAALLMESEAGAARYRGWLAKALAAKDAEGQLKPLADFLAAGHPLSSVSFSQVVDTDGTTRVVATPGGAGAPPAGAAGTKAMSAPQGGGVSAEPPEGARFIRVPDAQGGGVPAGLPPGARIVNATGDARNAIEVSDDSKSTFYEQAFSLTEYLLGHGKKEGILGSIAQGFAAGDDMADWLRKHGAEYGLPDTLDALERQWRDWVNSLPASSAT